MPHLRSTVSITPSAGLLCDFLVGVSLPHAQALRETGGEAPSPVNVRALLDTGATCSAIDSAILSGLRLTPSGLTSVQTPSTGAKPVERAQYDISLVIPLANNYTYTMNAIPVIETSLAPQGIDALIGMDVLSRGILILDGYAGHFILGF